MRLLRDADVLLTIGQYLRPSAEHLPLMKYYTPAEFMSLRRLGVEMGFRHVRIGPARALVLSRRGAGPRSRDRGRSLSRDRRPAAEIHDASTTLRPMSLDAPFRGVSAV